MVRRSLSGFLEELAAFPAILAGSRNRPGATPTNRSKWRVKWARSRKPAKAAAPGSRGARGSSGWLNLKHAGHCTSLPLTPFTGPLGEARPLDPHIPADLQLPGGRGDGALEAGVGVDGVAVVGLAQLIAQRADAGAVEVGEFRALFESV
jgi:hypothetical protein